MNTPDGLGSAGQDKRMDFSRSILRGVEIKRCCHVPHAYKSHVHKELSLGFITEGSTELTLSEAVLRYVAGDGVVIPPMMTHRCAPLDIDHWSYVMLFVEPEYYGDRVSFRQAGKLTDGQAVKLRNFIDGLLEERSPDTAENILIELLLESGEKSPEEPNTGTGDAMEAVRDHILRHVREEITLDMLEKLSGLNKFSLIRHFKRQYIATPAAYHLQCRVAEAKGMLGRGADALDVCGELGFYDQAHFIREFKKMYGVTPGAYRQQVEHP